MPTSPDTQTDRIFHALADRTRRDILTRSLSGEHSISELASAYDMSFAAVQKHVSVLHKAGLITKRRSGREALSSGNVQTIRTAAELLLEFEGIWRGRVARIDDLLTEEALNPAGRASKPKNPNPSCL